MKVSEKLINRLRKEFDDFNDHIPVSEKPRRLYHGHHQRSVGAWSWAIGGTIECPMSYGSSWNMMQLVKSKELSLFRENLHEVSILPEK